jgi:hypothetical protein
MKDEEQRLTGHLDTAIAEILAARTLHGGLPDSLVPGDVIDSALAHNPAVQAARQDFLSALGAINVEGDAVARQAYLRLEETGNALASASANTGCRVGLLAARAATNKP